MYLTKKENLAFSFMFVISDSPKLKAPKITKNVYTCLALFYPLIATIIIYQQFLDKIFPFSMFNSVIEWHQQENTQKTLLSIRDRTQSITLNKNPFQNHSCKHELRWKSIRLGRCKKGNAGKSWNDLNEYLLRLGMDF